VSGRDLLDSGAPTVEAVGRWVHYLAPFRIDHWIKNLMVPVGSTLALVTHRVAPDAAIAWDVLVAFLISGGVSSVNYALNEILDAPFDAQHPVKRARPIPSGLVRVSALLWITVILGGTTFAAAIWLLPAPFTRAAVALVIAGLLYNLPPIRLKDWPYLDALVESLTNPIRLAIGWYAVSTVSPAPSPLLLGAVWAFGAFAMTGKRLAELRLLGDAARRYRPTFAAYSVPALLAAQLGYAAVALVALAGLFASRPVMLWSILPLVGLIVVWTLEMTFEPQSPLLEPERLHRRPLFVLMTLAVFGLAIVLALTD
jgi:4-hydroxybenzoate polyprenyltransferase